MAKESQVTHCWPICSDSVKATKNTVWIIVFPKANQKKVEKRTVFETPLCKGSSFPRQIQYIYFYENFRIKNTNNSFKITIFAERHWKIWIFYFKHCSEIFILGQRISYSCPTSVYFCFFYINTDVQTFLNLPKPQGVSQGKGYSASPLVHLGCRIKKRKKKKIQKNIQ